MRKVEPYIWLTPSIPLMGIMILVTIPSVTLCVLSGLQSIDTSLYEEAAVDGAIFWNKLFRVTLPLLIPSLMVSTVLNIICVFNSFPIIWTISKGDPADQTHTLVTCLYKRSFTNQKIGEAAAVSVVGFMILAACCPACGSGPTSLTSGGRPQFSSACSTPSSSPAGRSGALRAGKRAIANKL